MDTENIEFDELDEAQNVNESMEDDDLDDESDDEIDDENIEEKLEIEIKEKQDAISLNPFDYDKHVELIELLNGFGESRYDELKSVRERMSSIFPLTPKLWLDWLEDERNRIVDSQNADQTKHVLNLFERAIQDYVSIDIWIKYQQFVLHLNSEGDNVDLVKIYEQSLASVGLHPIKGYIVWDIYRFYEDTLVEFETDKEKQLKRVFSLYQRQLSIPSIQLDVTYEDFKKWISKTMETYPNVVFNCASIESIYKKSKNEFEKIRPFEDDLAKSPTIDNYFKYLDYEIKQKNPTRIQFLFERAITDHCLISELWIKYLKYLQDNLNFFDVLVAVLKRAVRNVVWCVEIWIEYIRTIERFDRTEQEAQEIFEKGLTSLQTGEDFRKFWLSYLEYKRRKTDFNDLKQIEKLRKNFEACIQHLSKIADADPYFTVSIYQAKIEAKFCSNISKSREIWDEIMTYHKELMGKQVNYWLEYANLERMYGDEENFKKVMLKALNYCPESFDMLSGQLIRYFKEESDSIKKIDAVEKNILGIFDRVVKTYREKKEESGKGLKRKENPFSKFDPKSSKKFKNEPIEPPPQTVEFKKPSSDVNELNTVIVKNLSFDLDENRLMKEFSKFGDIKDVRLVRKYNGKSKGFCYIEFSSIEGAKNAVRNDRMLIDERPAFISEMNKNPEFRYKTDLEKNKLFVSKLPSRITLSRLNEIFSKFDGFKEVRLNTYRNGFSKGNAYVEFKTDQDASRALMKTDNIEIDGKKISVQLSDPPKKSSKEKDGRALGDAMFKKPTAFGRAKPKLQI